MNTATVRSLSNALLLQENVDAGWRVILPGADGQSLENWDGKGGFSHLICDECSRPQALYEKQEDCPQPSTVERFTYGDNSAESAWHNQCGRLTRHDDTAGTRRIHEYALTGGALAENRRFLASVLPPDWPEDADQRGALLESVEGFTSSACVDANARSGISLATDDTAKTRIAITLNQGRGTFRHNTDEPGATMLEWTAFMSRLDNLNPKSEGGLPAASSWNLDGGDSSALGVLNDAGEHLLRVNTLKLGRGLKPARGIGNFLSWHLR